ncbi:hypothetical protein [Circoviridae sp.]|nr:hypothetical protein [Circoviridae sp.]
MKRAWVNYAYKPHMHAHAGNFIRKRLRTQLYYRKRDLFGNFKQNMERKLNNSYKVGWSAPDAVGAARRAQYKWRRAYFLKHGRVI